MSSEKPIGENVRLMLCMICFGFVVLGVALGIKYFLPSVELLGDMEKVSSTSDQGPCALSEKTIQKIKTAAVGEMRAFAPMDRPYSVASFRFVDKEGAPKTMQDWEGKTTLVNLWATWCAPCRAEMPSLDELQATLGGDAFEVLPISVDRSDPSKPKGFFQEISIKAMRFFHDREAMTLNALKRDGLALGLPATLLVDGRGCAIGRINGPAEWASEDAKRLIKAAL